MDASDYLDSCLPRVDRALDEALPRADAPPERLHAAMRHLIFPGGKRLRPALALAAAEAVGGDADAALPAAVAVELVHVYSLVHDDLPCMDDDVERRGRPTVHVAFDEATGSFVPVSRGSDPYRADRTRLSPLLVWHPSEFSRLRLQYNYDVADDLDEEHQHSVWAGMEFLFGSHPAHGY